MSTPAPISPPTPVPAVPQRPAWAETLRDKYLTGEASIFLVHGNVFDYVQVGDRSMGLIDYLAGPLFADNKKLVAELSWSQGLRRISTAANGAVDLVGSGFAMPPAELASGGVGEALRRVEAEIRKQSVALLVPYANTLLPAGDPAFLSNEERAAFTTLHRWSLDASLSKMDCVVVLIAESIAEVNPALLTSPRVVAIEIGLPDEALRTHVVRIAAPGMDDDSVRLLAAHTSGLRAIQVERIVASQAPTALDEETRRTLLSELLAGQDKADERAAKLAAITAGKTAQEIRDLVAPGAAAQVDNASVRDQMLQVIHARKRELIEKECGGLISFMETRHGLEAVGGNALLKQELLEIAGLLKSGNRRLSPMGLLAVGPMGAGKTFVIRALLKEAGLTGVALKNFRSKWQGATEANLERVLATVKAMGPIAVVIDESDRSFGRAEADTDGGVSARVMARLKEFMSDTDNRGQVLFILMTNRPDRIETDLKRPGRLDRKIPFFYAEDSAERAAVLKAILGRNGSGDGLDWTGVEALCDRMDGYSNADIEAVALLGLEFAARRQAPLDNALLDEAITDFIPPREQDMVRLMELLAAQETSRRSLLPERFRNITSTELNAQIGRLRAALGAQG